VEGPGAGLLGVELIVPNDPAGGLEVDLGVSDEGVGDTATAEGGETLVELVGAGLDLLERGIVRPGRWRWGVVLCGEQPKQCGEGNAGQQQTKRLHDARPFLCSASRTASLLLTILSRRAASKGQGGKRTWERESVRAWQ